MPAFVEGLKRIVGRRSFKAAFALSVLAIAVMLVAVSLEKLSSTEFGLKYDTVKRKLSGTVFEEGLHAGPPFFSFIKFSSTYVGEEIDTLCYTMDGLEVRINTVIQYLPDRAFAEEIVTKYRNEEKHREMVRAGALSALQHGCGDFTVAEWPKKRQEVQERQKTLMIQKLAEVHAIGLDVQLRDFQLPSRFVNKVEEKEKARVDIELARREQIQALTAAELELGRAILQGEQRMDDGQREADVLLREAELEAEGISFAFEREAQIAKRVMDMQNLTVQGLLAYQMNRAIESSSFVSLALTEPAQGSYKEDL